MNKKLEIIKEKFGNFFSANPKTKKIVGVLLIVIGLLALVTPLTPGSWLIVVGLQFLGLRLLVWKKLKAWFRKKEVN